MFHAIIKKQRESESGFQYSFFHFDKEYYLYQILSLIGILFGFTLPVNGIGFSVCIFYNITGIPCPSCGLTRSAVNIFHGNILHSLLYHPFGILVVPVMILIASSAFFPSLANFYRQHKMIFSKMAAVVFTFLALFGIARAIMLAYYPDLSIRLFHAFNEPSFFSILKKFQVR